MQTPSSYQEHAQEFMLRRDQSKIGVSTVLKWAKSLPPHSSILDLGCGSGKPIGTALAVHDFMMFGIDASETLVAAYRQNLPRARVICEAIETSTFFNRQFDAAIAIGLIFLLPENTQIQLIRKIATTLTTGGRFLLTAPTQIHQWRDILTEAESLSLGRDSYLDISAEAGLSLENEWVDEGENHYYAFSRSSTQT